jgi:hypothetical protein
MVNLIFGQHKQKKIWKMLHCENVSSGIMERINSIIIDGKKSKVSIHLEELGRKCFISYAVQHGNEGHNMNSKRRI